MQARVFIYLFINSENSKHELILHWVHGCGKGVQHNRCTIATKCFSVNTYKYARKHTALVHTHEVKLLLALPSLHFYGISTTGILPAAYQLWTHTGSQNTVAGESQNMMFTKYSNRMHFKQY